VLRTGISQMTSRNAACGLGCDVDVRLSARRPPETYARNERYHNEYQTMVGGGCATHRPPFENGTDKNDTEKVAASTPAAARIGEHRLIGSATARIARPTSFNDPSSEAGKGVTCGAPTDD
jgi:hypothetical protein